MDGILLHNIKSHEYFRETRLSILTSGIWTSMDKHAAVSNVDFDQFINFAKHLTDHLYIQCLAQGNMVQNDILKCISDLKCILKYGPLLPKTYPRIKVTEIPLGEKCCRVKNVNSMDANSVVTNYYQSGPASIKLGVTMELLMVNLRFTSVHLVVLLLTKI